MNTLATLPTVDALVPDPARPVLLFDDHAVCIVTPATLPAPLLCPLPTGDAVLLSDWGTPGRPAYLIPASLVADVRRVLRLEVMA